MIQQSPQNNQPQFDSIEATGVGFSQLYQNRLYIIKLMAFPFFIKLICLMALLLMEQSANHFSYGLILLPAFFAEGWLLAQIARSTAFQEYWPMKLTGESELDNKTITSRHTALLASIITYVIIKIGFVIVQTLTYVSPEDFKNLELISEGLPPEGDISVTIVPTVLILLVTIVYWFPLIWFYIPAALNIGFKDFYKTIVDNRLTIKMFFTWIICVGPLFVALLITRDFLMTALGMDIKSLSHAETLLLIGLDQFFTMVGGIVCTIAMIHAFKPFFVAPNN